MKKLLRYGVVSLSLAALGLTATDSPVLGVQTVWADGTGADNQAALTAIEAKRDEVLAKLRQLAGDDAGVEEVFYGRFYRLKDLSNSYYRDEVLANPAETIQNLDTELFRLELLTEVYGTATAYYQSLDTPKSVSFLTFYRGRTADFTRGDSTTNQRYTFAEADLSLISGDFHYLYRLTVSNNENDLLQAKDELLEMFKTAADKRVLTQELRQRYNETVRYFNSQAEDVRKAQYDSFAREALNELYYAVTGELDDYNVEQLRIKLTKVDNKIRGKNISQAQHDQFSQELAAKKAEVLAALSKLEAISIVGPVENLEVHDGRYIRAESYYDGVALPAEVTLEEAETFKARKEQEWDDFLAHMTLVNRFFERANQLGVTYGANPEEKLTYRIEVEVSPVTPVRPATTSQNTGRISKEKAYFSDYAVTESLYRVAHANYNNKEEIAETTAVAEEKLTFWEKRLLARDAVVTAYNKLVDKVNPILEEDKTSTLGTKLVYLGGYMPDNLRSLAEAKTVEELDTKKEELLKLLAEFDEAHFGANQPDGPTSGGSSDKNKDQKPPLTGPIKRPSRQEISPTGSLAQSGAGIVAGQVVISPSSSLVSELPVSLKPESQSRATSGRVVKQISDSSTGANRYRVGLPKTSSRDNIFLELLGVLFMLPILTTRRKNG